MKRIDFRGQALDAAQLRHVLPRGGQTSESMAGIVQPIIEEVRVHGAEAVQEFSQQFDGIAPDSIRVPDKVIQHSLDNLDSTVHQALTEAISQVRAFHSSQKPSDHTEEIIPGGKITERFIPIQRVGLYVPGGQAVYPSSVVMNVVPAQEAGVSSIVVASPPQQDNGGWPHPTILAACAILGVDEVWAAGGAQGIALFAYGDSEQTLEPVDLITGPGNIFVATAKTLVKSHVGIDAEAGPTEIAILADETANPVYLAYDLISQAEHDVLAASVLITDSLALADQVEQEITARYKVTLNADRVFQALEGQQSGIILVDSLDQGIEVANAYGAEHLEIQTQHAEDVSQKIVNAGAIFVGENSPVPLGDYAAGSNHVLPTSGTARYTSGLSTHTFLKAVHVIEYNRDALASIADTVVALADEEKLPAHGESIKARIYPQQLHT